MIATVTTVAVLTLSLKYMFTKITRTFFLVAVISVFHSACSVSNNSDAAFQKASYKRSMSELRKAKSEEDRFYALGYAALLSLNQGQVADARAFAVELERLSPKYKNNWDHSAAVEKYNIVLGRIALKEGDVDTAKIRLLAAGRSPGSPYFGPNMSLASDLLDKNEKSVVLEYFELCRKHWVMDDGRIDLWKRDVARRRHPDFGANLDY